MGNERVYDADAFISDESSYYGDEADKEKWCSQEEERTGLNMHLLNHPNDLNTLAYEARRRSTISEQTEDAQAPEATLKDTKGNETEQGDGNSIEVSIRSSATESQSQKKQPVESEELYHKTNARRPDESVDDFLERVPPIGNPGYLDGWIWISNPHPSEADRDRGDVTEFLELVAPWTEAYMAEKRRLEAEDLANALVTRRLGPARDKLRQKIEQIAKQQGVVSGKWMLFPQIKDVPKTWRTICEAVVNNRLGTSAKIADGSSSRDKKARLICVYTKDFSDREDVKRVCQGLRDIGLLSSGVNRQQLYYKADAYTHLNINADNPYKLQASMYSSEEILPLDLPSIYGELLQPNGPKRPRMDDDVPTAQPKKQKKG